MTLDELAELPTKSTQHMSIAERRDGIAVMLDDLRMLATRDGCIAAGWALEFIESVTALARPAKPVEANGTPTAQ